jgi:hypothetical protein
MQYITQEQKELLKYYESLGDRTITVMPAEQEIASILVKRYLIELVEGTADYPEVVKTYATR